MANSVDPVDCLFSLILVYPVCSDMSVQIPRIITVRLVLFQVLIKNIEKFICLKIFEIRKGENSTLYM